MQYKKSRYLPQNEKKDQRNRIITLCVLAAVVILLFVVLMNVMGNNRSVTAAKLRCISTQEIRPFGNNVLYYDGSTLYCLSPSGSEKWSYTLGSNASFTCNDRCVVAWSNSQLHILDPNGQPTYNENLANTIQFAKAGSRYVAIVMGTDVGPVLEIKDLQGTTIDKETTAYQDMIILDLGFFDNGEYLWTTSLDVYGTVPNTILHTYKVNMTNSGEISLGENLAYDVVFAGGKLNVITTRQVRRFDYRGTEDTQNAVLVYGWQLADHDVSGNNAMMLFSLSNNSTAGMNQLRLLYGDMDKRFTMPSFCVGAALYNKRIYAFSSDTLYRAGINAQRFEAIALPKALDGLQVNGYLGMLSGGTALLTCTNGEVYAVTLP